MDIREILAQRVASDDQVFRSELVEGHERLRSLLQEGSGAQLDADRGESDLISKGTLPVLQIHHQRYAEKDAFGRAVDCSHQKFMHTFFSGLTQEELITRSYLGGLAVVGLGAVVGKYSPRVGQAMMLGGATGNIFGAFQGLRYLNGVKDYYSRTPTCTIFGGGNSR